MTATMTIRTTAALGTHSLPSDPLSSSLSQSAAPPPGRLQHEQCAAGPDEGHRQRHDDVRHPGHDDEAAVDRAEDDAQDDHADDDRDGELFALALHEGGRDDAGQGHHRADRQVDPARDHDDRLADGRQREWQDGDREALDPGHAVRRLDDLREGEQDRRGRRRARGSRCSAATRRRAHRRDRSARGPTVSVAALTGRRPARGGGPGLRHRPHRWRSRLRGSAVGRVGSTASSADRLRRDLLGHRGVRSGGGTRRAAASARPRRPRRSRRPPGRRR